MALTIDATPLFGPTPLSTTVAILGTIPSTGANTTVLTNGQMRFTNITSGSITITAYAVPQGVAPSSVNAFADAEPVAANSHIDMAIPLIQAGGTLQAMASANTSINAFQLSGVIVAQ